MLVLLLFAGLPAAQAVEAGFVETFSEPGTAGWTGGTPASNPGTGGVDGAGDGYLLLSSTFAGNFGTRSTTDAYRGDWTAAGITEVSFYLNDVNDPQDFCFHFLLTDQFGATWQNNQCLEPPNGTWQKYTIALNNGSDWTRIHQGFPPSSPWTLADTLEFVDRAHFRHDLPPYSSFPDPIAGDLGIDNIRLGAEIDCEDPPPGLPDSDGDGVPDACDLCPGTVPGSPVDSDGCPPLIPGDFDRDGDVDDDDFAAFVACVSGPNVPHPSGCEDKDFDSDGDVDHDDFGIFQRCYSGPNNPADPACAA